MAQDDDEGRDAGRPEAGAGDDRDGASDESGGDDQDGASDESGGDDRDGASDESGGDGGPVGDTPDQQTLDDLGARIEAGRGRLAEQLELTDEGEGEGEGEAEPAAGEGAEEPAFIEKGEASEDEPVDDTIAPPG